MRIPPGVRKSAAYNSKFREWDVQASVRHDPRIIFQDEESMGRVYFSPDLVPIVRHPLVVKLGPAASREILIQHLYNYLDFTASPNTSWTASA